MNAKPPFPGIERPFGFAILLDLIYRFEFA